MAPITKDDVKFIEFLMLNTEYSELMDSILIKSKIKQEDAFNMKENLMKLLHSQNLKNSRINL